MKCIVLAGGLGARLRPLTFTTPKALLEVKGKPLIEYTLDALPPEITSVVIAVKHLGQKIKKRIGKKYGKKKIVYVDLISLRGTMDALKQCKKYVKEKVLVLNGDDIYRKNDLIKIMSTAQGNEAAWAILVKEDANDKRSFDRIIIKEGKAEDIRENGPPFISEPPPFAKENEGGGETNLPPAGGLSPLRRKWFINTGAYIIDERIFRYKPVKTPKGEYGLPQTMLSAKNEISTVAVTASYWYSVNTKEDYEKIQHPMLNTRC